MIAPRSPELRDSLGVRAWAAVVRALFVLILALPLAASALAQQADQEQQEEQAQEEEMEGGERRPEVGGAEGVVQARPLETYNPVTAERLLNPEPGNWLQFRREYNGWGYSPLDQISTENVSNLRPVWTLASRVDHNHEAPPVVNDGVMFVTSSFNKLWALDAATGEIRWSYERDLPEAALQVVCCDVVNRGVGLWDDKVFMVTLDSHLLAFDAKTGEIVWDRTVADYRTGHAMTIAPLVVEGKVMVGVSGGEYGVRGFVQAFDANSGDILWKTFTVPGPGEPGNETWPGDTWMYGGATVWVTGSYDPELNLTYWGTGNGGPWMGDARPGDNLYIASAVAINADTGVIEHHFQYVPNDTWDYDETNEHVLVDVERNGETIKGALHVARSGFLYLLDRTDLSFVYAEPLTDDINVFTGHEEDGRPIRNPEKVVSIGSQVSGVCPAWSGSKNWNPTAYNPDTGLLYTSIEHLCMTISGTAIQYKAGQTYIGAQFSAEMEPNAPDYAGELAAFDPATGQRVWSNTYPFMRASILTTAGGLVFAGGTPDQFFRAFDAETGDELWKTKTSSGVYGVPTTYEVDGVQYVAVWSGWQPSSSRWGVVSEALGLNPEIPQGGTLWVFALEEE
jgi:alcohol dehydrogenase (cytochrome c)